MSSELIKLIEPTKESYLMKMGIEVELQTALKVGLPTVGSNRATNQFLLSWGYEVTIRDQISLGQRSDVIKLLKLAPYSFKQSERDEIILMEENRGRWRFKRT